MPVNSALAFKMGRSEKEEQFREQFLDEIVNHGTGIEDMSTLARRFDDGPFRNVFLKWSRSGREIFFIKEIGFVNVHIRSEPPGFWGVTKNVLKDFKDIKENLKISCFFVLIVGNDHGTDLNGYILKDMKSYPLIKAPSEQEDAYKINETDLDKNEVILSLRNIVEAVICEGKKDTKPKVIRRAKTKNK